MNSSNNSSKPTILIVDDTFENIGILAAYLEAETFHVLVAQNGEEALQRIESSCPDLILLDVVMPGMDGFEICRRLKANQATVQIPVIFMTALADTDSTIRGFEVGAVDFITKPFHIGEVLARINTHLGIQSMRRQLESRNTELNELNIKLSQMQAQLLQSEKLASIGQLAAGVAHEINNPIGFIQANVSALNEYFDSLLEIFSVYEAAEPMLNSPEFATKISDLRKSLDLDYLKRDIPTLVAETMEGISRVRQIVNDLRDFSRVDGNQTWQWTNLHQGIDSTLNIIGNEIKCKADIVKEYGQIQDIECLPSQLNQVIMNLMMNAVQAIEAARGKITIRTGSQDDHVWIEIADTGIGIPQENLSRIFDPFFTTKPIGKGTGLGLSLCYGIVQKHLGRIEVHSVVGQGTTFRVALPVRHLVEV